MSECCVPERQLTDTSGNLVFKASEPPVSHKFKVTASGEFDKGKGEVGGKPWSVEGINGYVIFFALISFSFGVSS